MNDNTTRLVPTQIGSDFVPLNRALTWAEDIKAWQSAAQAMNRFLDALEATVNSGEVESNWSRAASARVFSILLTLMAESGQYRHETSNPASDMKRHQMLMNELLPGMGKLRHRAVKIAKDYLSRPVFNSLAPDIKDEIFPLLDNMTPDLIRQAVVMRDQSRVRVELEVSGNVNLDNVRQYAETGVERISIGALTHSAPSLDVSLDIVG